MKVGFVFPGQGSQKVGMGKECFDSSQRAKEIMNVADEVLGKHLTHIMFEGPMETLTQTVNAQPAIFLVSAVFLDQLKQDGIFPYQVAGHSLGELTAYYAAGVLDFETSLKLIHFRAQVMAEAHPAADSAMTAILGLELSKVSEIINEHDDAYVANINCPGQVVISGRKTAIQSATERLKSEGAKAIPLPVSGAFHSSLMQPAADRLKQYVDELKLNPAECPIILNRTGKVETDVETLRTNIYLQVVSSVHWTDSILTMAESTDQMIECGYGKLLRGLIKKILPDSDSFDNVNSMESVKAYIQKVREKV